MRPEIEKIARDFTKDIKKLYGKKLVSIFLYGSAAGEDYIPGKSDINFLVVLEEINVGDLDLYLKKRSKWERKKVVTPLFLTEDYIRRSLDVFPIEFLDLKEKHVTLYGKDLLAELTIDPANLRLQIESEIKGKLLRLRQSYMELEGKPKKVKKLLDIALSSLTPAFRNLLRLVGEEVPLSKPEILEKIARRFALDPDLFGRWWRLKTGEMKASAAEIRKLFGDIHEEIEKLMDIVDGLKV
ncbi:MAG: hypothetical protein J7K11_04995 [Candidatus Hydrothermae bacterium]|nr:hypothetical protein [Candidatus Hydrothermae bacterium]